MTEEVRSSEPCTLRELTGRWNKSYNMPGGKLPMGPKRCEKADNQSLDLVS